MLQYLFTYLTSIFSDEEGQDLAEYAILLGLIAMVVLLAVVAVGTNLSTVFGNFSTNISGWFSS
ncbi:MAG: Flp family type IVb pilin [Chloroflexota bacterium]|nr:Flp family type IVb pilin [Chloroflexota bacterium]